MCYADSSYLGHRIDARVRAVLQVEKSEIEQRETRAQRGHGADLKEAAVELERAEVRQSEREKRRVADLYSEREVVCN